MIRSLLKPITFLVFLIITTLFGSCKNEEVVPGAACNVKSVSIIKESDSTNASFDFNAQGQMIQFKSGSTIGSLVHTLDSVIIRYSRSSLREVMYTQGDKWTKSVFYSPSRVNDSTVNTITTVTTPTYSGAYVVSIKRVNTLIRRIGNVIDYQASDSTITNFNYNSEGNVVSIVKDRSAVLYKIVFSYLSNTNNVKSNNYFTFRFFNKFVYNGMDLPIITGKFNLFKTPPTQLYQFDSYKDRINFTNFKTNSEGYISEYESLGFGLFNSPQETYKYVYECK
jgi:hypothetical protein